MKNLILKYYLIIALPIILFVIILSVLKNNFLLLIYFLLFGVAGMLGEALFSWSWNTFYLQKFWDYKAQTLLKNYTSYLNLIPWGLGGLIYWWCFIKLSNGAISLTSNNNEIFYALGIFFGIQLLTLSIKLILKTKFKKITLLNSIYFYLPLIICWAHLIIFIDIKYFSIFLITGTTAFLTEYLFGKICHKVLGKRLWTYNCASFDRGHITLFSIPAFIQSAIYIMFVGEIFKKIL